jgi:hypothetical protein
MSNARPAGLKKGGHRRRDALETIGKRDRSIPVEPRHGGDMLILQNASR